MPRRAHNTDNFLAQVRAYFGLDQQAMALYLGVSPSLIRAIEAGSRELSSAVMYLLLPLAQHLPATPPPTAPTALPPALPPGTSAPPDARALDLRRRTCLLQATRLRRQLAGLEQRALVAQRWAQALPALLPTVPAAAEAVTTTPADAAERAAFLTEWLARRARPLPAADATQWRLWQARIVALEAEAAALAE